MKNKHHRFQRGFCSIEIQHGYMETSLNNVLQLIRYSQTICCNIFYAKFWWFANYFILVQVRLMLLSITLSTKGSAHRKKKKKKPLAFWYSWTICCSSHLYPPAVFLHDLTRGEHNTSKKKSYFGATHKHHVFFNGDHKTPTLSRRKDRIVPQNITHSISLKKLVVSSWNGDKRREKNASLLYLELNTWASLP